MLNYSAESEKQFSNKELSQEAYLLISSEIYSFISRKLDVINLKIEHDGASPELLSQLKVLLELVFWYRDNYGISAKYLFEKLDECKEKIMAKEKL